MRPNRAFVAAITCRTRAMLWAMVLQPNYLNAEKDRIVVVDSMRLIRRIFGSRQLAPYIEAEIAQGPSVSTDEELLDFARRNASTAYHLSGICKMGAANDPSADG
jgi:choline dehydrogenase